MSQLTTKGEGLKNSLNPRYTKVEAEASQGSFTIHAVMISEVNKIGIIQKVEIEEFNLMVEFSMGKIEVDLGTNKITGMILGEDTLEVT